jgi:hypothetical protein
MRAAAGLDDRSQRSLQPTEELVVGQIDLHDYFNLDEPGQYRVQLLFNVESGLGGGKSQPCEFTIAE